MSNEQFRILEKHLAASLAEVLSDKPLDELKKLDWLSLNPDFHIEQDSKSRRVA